MTLFKRSLAWLVGCYISAALAAAPTPGGTLKLTTPRGYLPPAPIMVWVEIVGPDGQRDRNLWDAEATLSSDNPAVTLSTNKVALRNGLGSALVAVSGSANFSLSATLASLSATRSITNLSAAPVTVASGTLPGVSTTWSGVVRVANDVTVPVGHTLTIRSNTLVIVAGVASGTSAADLIVNGAVVSQGAEDHPVSITCSNATLNWGQIRHVNAQPSTYRYTFISKAGRATGEGHTGTAPAIRANNSTIILERSSISDLTSGATAIGKAMMADGSAITLRDCILARSRMGPEIATTSLACTNTWMTDMRGPDDCDGIYLHNSSGQPLTLSGCMLAFGDDDAVDTLNSVVTIENTIIRDWPNTTEDAKGISAFHGEVRIRRCLFVNCFVGVAAKSGGPQAVVRIDQSTIIGNSRGVSAAFKDNATVGNIDFRITNSIVRAPDAVHTDFGATNFTILYSDLTEPWTGTGNVTADPLFVDSTGGDFRLQSFSPCIDTGDPAAALDPDGTRTDMGAIVFSDRLIPLGSRWKYLDNGTDQGASWTTLEFNDSAWAEGAAQLGYGDGDETTVVSFGPQANNKYVTTYFRRKFVLANAALAQALTLKLLRDDGAVVYINGQEAWRTNMPAGAVDFLTFASVGGEWGFETNSLPVSLLAEGTNIVAVEMHQATPDSTDLSLDLELLAVTSTPGNAPPSVEITSPPNGASFVAPTSVIIDVAAADPDGSVSIVEFFQNGVKLGEDPDVPYSFPWNNVPEGIYALTAVATDNTGARSTSAPITITVNSSTLSTNAFVPFASTWKYLDNGSDQGTNWIPLGFDDSSWSNGIAQLGYGDGDETTVIGYGPNAGDKYPTAYFRHKFVVEDPTRVQSLTAVLLRDDGAAVYLNGKDVWRVDLAPDAGYRTYALGASDYPFITNQIAVSNLVAGTNIVAVEMHQGTPGSSDLSMELALLAVIDAPTNFSPVVTLTSPPNNTTLASPANVTLAASASDRDGTIMNVAFYANGNKLTDDTSEPFTYNWNSVGAGSYLLTAVATDDVGLMSTSAVVNLTVSTDIAPPVVSNKNPLPGSVTNLTQLTVTFSKAVVGVDAADLLVNGTPAANVTGSGAVYMFEFPQPAYGTVAISWSGAHGITDVFTPPHAFNGNGAGATWQYQLLDVVPPLVSTINPVPGSTVAALASIAVTFSESVTGVNASDLRINGTAANTLSGSGAGPYLFGFVQPSEGAVQVNWAAGHGIQDTAANAFAGTPWSYSLDTNASGVVISEIMFHASSENVLEEYIELHNKGASAVDLTGWKFTQGIQYTFPTVSIPAGGYLVVAADLPTFTAKYPGVTNVIGPWNGFLNNSSEDIDLEDASGERVDQVEYADEGEWAIRRRGLLHFNHRGWVWFAEHDGLGKSVELINPHVSNDSGQNWASSFVTNGTPGGANSVLTNNIAPLILDATHFPVIPSSTSPVLISAQIVDETAGGIVATLSHRVSAATPPAFTDVPMRDDGTDGDPVANDGRYSAVIGALANATVVEWYITASDQGGNIRTWPAAALPALDQSGPATQAANALYQVDDSVYTGGQPIYRFIMAEPERAELASIPPSGDRNSDAQMNATFVSIDGGGTELRYLIGLRNRGHGSRGANPPNYRVNFRSDEKWKDVTALNLNTRQVHIQHLGSILSRKSGAAGANTIAVQVRVNSSNRADGGAPMFGSYAANEALNGDWADNHFPFDGNGNVYRAIRDIFPPDFSYRGENPNSYRNTWFKDSNTSEDDWTDLIAMLRVVGINNLDPFTSENVRQVINVEQWLRHLAVMNLLGNSETGLNSGYNDDYFMYRGINDPRFLLIYYDLDQILGQGGSFGPTAGIFSATQNNGAGQAFDRLMHWPDFEPIYYQILRELLETTFAQSNFNALVDQTLTYAPGVTGAIKSWMDQRRTFVLSQLPPIPNTKPALAAILNAPRSPTPFTTANLTVGGEGVTHYRFSLNGAAYSLERPIITPISLSGLSNGTNTVSVIGRGTNNVWQAETSATVRSWVVNTSWPTVRINEVLALNDAAYNHSGTFPDYIELFNEGAATVNLTGFRLSDEFDTPNKFTFPAGTSIAPGAYLVVYANNPGTPGLHTGFGLDQTGDDVYLFSHFTNGNVLLDSVEFGSQLADLSIGRLAGGDWVLTHPTHGGANIAAATGSAPNLRINEWLTAGFSPYPFDFIELYNTEPAPVALGGLHLTDEPIGAPARHRIFPLTFIGSNAWLHFVADGEAGRNHLDFRLAVEQGEIGLFGADLSVIDCVTYGPQQPDVARGRCPDGALRQTALSFATPGGPNACPFVPPTGTIINLVTISNSWRYDESGVDLGTSWIQPGYNDNSWSSGLALLADELGLLPEPIRTVLDAVNNKWTFYFRTHFNVAANLNASALDITHVIDDGAVVYLNGQELYRFNMPGGTVVYNTPAGGIGDAIYQGPFRVPATNLLAGDNVIAVEVHQNAANSGDIVFGLRLDAVIVTNNPVLAGIVINEVLANNESFEEPNGSKPDWVEVYNPSGSAVDLANMSLTDDLTLPRRWVFPAGAVLPSREAFAVRFDPDTPMSATNTGFGLRASGGAVYLFHKPADGGTIASSITYGFQAPDWSIGRIPDGGSNWVLTVPTLGGSNLVASLGDPFALRANEWMASPASGADWFEIYNPNPQPVDMSRMYLSDQLGQPTKHQLPALCFIGVGPFGYQKFDAGAAAPEPGAADQFPSGLSAGGEWVVISSSSGTLIDVVEFEAQEHGVSEGRLPDGTPNIQRFPITATPGEANFLPLTSVVINEVLSHSELPLEDAVELYNPTGDDVDITGWYLSDSDNNLLKFRITNNAVVPAGGYLVLYENQFNFDNLVEPFSFNSSRGDDVFLSEASSPGVLTGYRAFSEFGPQENGVSFGRFVTSVGADFPAMSARSLGVDNPATVEAFRTGGGLTNPYPRIGPIIINEFMYHPADDNDGLEYLELHNILGSPVQLFDSARPENTWRMRKGIDFDFPQGTVIPGGGFLVLVSFDPVTDPVSLAAFHAAYGTNATLIGPYSSKLDNAGEAVELQKPDAPVTDPGFDFGRVPYVVVDRIVYGDGPPWPVSADGFGDTLARVSANQYGNDPVNWAGAAPTVGFANFSSGGSNAAPVLSVIGDKMADEGVLLNFTATASDPDAPAQTLTFSLDPGAPAGASITPGGAFSWTPSESQGPGSYPVTVRVTDSGSPVLSDFETISIIVGEVNVAPLLNPIGNKQSGEGTLITFTATAFDDDEPVQTLTFTLQGAIPSGASFNPNTGVFTWTPTEAQGPGSYPLTIHVTDSGSPTLSDSESITITVNEVNTAPVLTAIGNKSVTEGTTLNFTASANDTDVPVQSLTFSLGAGSPSGATINPATGAFQWTPPFGSAPLSHEITITVSDNGSPFLTDSETITVFVLGGPEITSLTRSPSGEVTIQWQANAGSTYRVQRSVDLVNWTDLLPLVTASGATASFSENTGVSPQRFYRVLLVD